MGACTSQPTAIGDTEGLERERETQAKVRTTKAGLRRSHGPGAWSHRVAVVGQAPLKHWEHLMRSP